MLTFLRWMAGHLADLWVAERRAAWLADARTAVGLLAGIAEGMAIGYLVALRMESDVVGVTCGITGAVMVGLRAA